MENNKGLVLIAGAVLAGMMTGIIALGRNTPWVENPYHAAIRRMEERQREISSDITLPSLADIIASNPEMRGLEKLQQMPYQISETNVNGYVTHRYQFTGGRSLETHVTRDLEPVLFYSNGGELFQLRLPGNTGVERR